MDGAGRESKASGFQNALNRLEGKVTQLENLLSKIEGSVVPGEKKPIEKQPSCPSPPISVIMGEYPNRICKLTDKIEEMIKRLEEILF